MGLMDDIKDEKPRIGGQCSIPAFMDSLSQQDRTDLVAALADPLIPTSAICRALQRHGHIVNSSTLNRHRKGGCRCESR